MTTEELKKKLEELGLTLKHCSTARYAWYQIEDEDGDCYGSINLLTECAADIDEEIFEDSEKQRKLFNAVTKYAATPIKERDPKRYFKYRLKPFAGNKTSADFLTFFGYLGFKKCANRFNLVTQYEDIDKGWQTIFEENDPLLDGVSLEMFEAIEVDKEENEL